jgi:hypothetical protein
MLALAKTRASVLFINALPPSFETHTQLRREIDTGLPFQHYRHVPDAPLRGKRIRSSSAGQKEIVMNRKQTHSHLPRAARATLLAVLSLAVIVTLPTLSSATGNVVKADLVGTWQVALYGQGGCGVGTTVVNFTLNASGSATNATEKSHSVGCGDTTSTGNTFTIQTLNSNGSGTAGLSCGTGCGFTFSIQVSPDRSTFNLVDITDPNNFLMGVAVHQ